jgi:RHS repeat-associated protein
MLYAKGEAVGMNRLNVDDYTGGRGYLGKDIMGSVRGVSNDYGQLEERYEYDAFGKPYAGELNKGMNLGYTGKPYDTVTGMYNYGYRDYAPEAGRFTTEDPIRDGANWFAYVNNDPVNWVDLWGLETNVVVVHAGTWWEGIGGGSHVGVQFSNPAHPEQPTLYDPSGHYVGQDENGSQYRPSSGVFWGETDSNLERYTSSFTAKGEAVTIYTIQTMPEQEARMVAEAFEVGNGFGFSCAVNVSTVLAEIGVKSAITPGGLEKQLDKMVEQGEATKGCGD